MGKVMYLMTRLSFLGLVNSLDDSHVKLILYHTIILLELLWLLAGSLQQELLSSLTETAIVRQWVKSFLPWKTYFISLIP